MVGTLVNGGGRRHRPDRRPEADEILAPSGAAPDRAADRPDAAHRPLRRRLRGRARGLSLDVLLENPHGVDLGPLEPGCPCCAPRPAWWTWRLPILLADVDRLRSALSAPARADAGGPADLRFNNSWMHNVEVLVKGKPRCTVHVHPDDAARLGLADGADAEVSSRTGKVTIPVEVTDAIRPGWSASSPAGADVDGVELSVARRCGVNSNLLADDELIDPVSGTSVLNGIPVELSPV